MTKNLLTILGMCFLFILALFATFRRDLFPKIVQSDIFLAIILIIIVVIVFNFIVRKSVKVEKTKEELLKEKENAEGEFDTNGK